MPKIIFRNLSKRFDDHLVIERLNATIEDGEFLVLLGPSGCGKSTLLRMIAGLSEISAGELLFDGEVANDWDPARRGVAFVFQSYALYPHMSVRANIAFPLVMQAFRAWHHLPIVNSIAFWRLAKSPAIAGAVQTIAQQLELEALLDRRPAALSGGQRQRVALARALIRNPSLYLLDEPLSNLDAKLRTQMRAEITALHRKVGKTFVYVTHDQVEAMTMATRIVVMDKGVVQQIGGPDEIYENPANIFVAQFVGSPPMNVLPVTQSEGVIEIAGGARWTHPGRIAPSAKLILGIRPEKLTLRPSGKGLVECEVRLVERLGAETIVGVRLLAAADDEETGRPDPDLVQVRVAGVQPFAVGDRRALDYRACDALWFDSLTGQRVAATSLSVN